MPLSRPRWRLGAAATAVAALALSALVGPVSTADASPDAAARTSSVAALPAAELAQATSPNPAVDGDGFATFTFTSSTAGSAAVVGNFGPSNAEMSWTMSKAANGKFSVIVGPLDAGLYSYRLLVDGVATADPANPNVVHSAPTLTTFLVPGKDARFLTKRNVAHGKVSVLTYRSEVTGTDRKATVWTPPGYPRRGTSYPTFYLLHGGGGDYLDWVQQGRANIILDNLYAAGKMAPMVVVMSDGTVPGWASWPQQEDQFTPELLENLAPAVRANFQVSHRKADQAIAGLSMGGGQTMNVVLANPGVFRYVGVFGSGYFPATIEALETSTYLDKASVRKLNKQTKIFRFYIGNKIDIAYTNNEANRALFDSVGLRYQFNGSYLKSGHTWTTWQHDLNDFAPRLF